jgi:hypothetical protein
MTTSRELLPRHCAFKCKQFGIELFLIYCKISKNTLTATFQAKPIKRKRKKMERNKQKLSPRPCPAVLIIHTFEKAQLLSSMSEEDWSKRRFAPSFKSPLCGDPIEVLCALGSFRVSAYLKIYRFHLQET